MGKDVVVHTHINHPDEITDITRRAVGVLFARGVFVRSASEAGDTPREDALHREILALKRRLRPVRGLAAAAGDSYLVATFDDYAGYGRHDVWRA